MFIAIDDPVKHFWTKANKTDTCWLWTAAHSNKGYGRCRSGKKILLAHRVAWELTHGPVPDGMMVLHRCDVPACVNPAHLFIGTALDNRLDCSAKGRDSHGEAHHNSKLTSAEIRRIRDMRGTTQEVIANKFGIAQRTVSAILSGKRWRHVCD